MKNKIQQKIYRMLRPLVVLFLVLSTARVSAVPPRFTERFVNNSSSIPSAQVTQTIGFTMNSFSTVGSIQIEQCTNYPYIGTMCTPPAGLSLSSVVLDSQTGNTGFTFDIINSTSNKIILTRVPSPVTADPNTYVFKSITNPSANNQTVFIRISAYASTDATGDIVESGGVAYSTQGAFSVGAFVPPFLTFCAAVTVTQNCSASTGTFLSLGELLSTETKAVSSQFSGATNDPNGFSVYILGQTMTAGNQVISQIDNPTASLVGVSQFGINLRANTNPAIGANSTGNGTSVVSPNYNIANQFVFKNGDKLTSSSLSTEFNLQTVSYIVNVSKKQAPGFYATTVTYLAVAAF